MRLTTQLSDLQVAEIKRLAEENRLALGFVNTPIAAEIFSVLDKLDITLLQLPIESRGDRPAFSAAMIYSRDGDNELVFIGLNSADYYDKQLFAIAHELYHFFAKTGSHFSRVDDDATLIEVKANRFAAEFLLPEGALRNVVISEFKTPSLKGIPTKKLLRFVARLHCTWWLPYPALVRRLKEVDAVSDTQYEELCDIDARSPEGEYWRIGMATNDTVFSMLNRVTRITGTSPKSIEVIIRNFEDNLVDDDQFAELLELYGKSPRDFGYGYRVAEEDIKELETFFGGEMGYEGQPGI